MEQSRKKWSMFFTSITGADQGILVRGGAWIFCSMAWGSGAALRPPVGPGQRPGGFPGGEAPGTS